MFLFLFEMGVREADERLKMLEWEEIMVRLAGGWEKGKGAVIRKTWVQVLAVFLPSCVTSSR